MPESIMVKKGKTTIEIVILDDGRIKILTPGNILPEEHATAEEFVAEFDKFFQLDHIHRRGQADHHKHTHTHIHDKEGG